MYKQGRTARQIRAGIIKGDWKSVDLATAAASTERALAIFRFSILN